MKNLHYATSFLLVIATRSASYWDFSVEILLIHTMYMQTKAQAETHRNEILITYSSFWVITEHLSVYDIFHLRVDRWHSTLRANLPPSNFELCSGIFLWNFKLSNLNYSMYLKEKLFHGEQSSIISVCVTGGTSCMATPGSAPGTVVMPGAIIFWFFIPLGCSGFILSFCNTLFELTLGWFFNRIHFYALLLRENIFGTIVPNREPLSVKSPCLLVVWPDKIEVIICG